MIKNSNDRLAARIIREQNHVSRELGFSSEGYREFAGNVAEGLIRRDIIESFTSYGCGIGYVVDSSEDVTGDRIPPEFDGIIYDGKVYGSDFVVVPRSSVVAGIEVKASTYSYNPEKMNERQEWLDDAPMLFVAIHGRDPEEFIREHGKDRNFILGEILDEENPSAEDMVIPSEVDRIVKTVKGL